MPRLTEIMASGATSAPDKSCSACQKRTPVGYVQVEFHTYPKDNDPRGRTRTLQSASRGQLCRICGREFVERIQQLLGGGAGDETR